uniref:Uncharacterized protein n=1 Tax=Romanomermis culicivorax TaxID=13658 RepID=A0A915J5S4_ROMCU
MVQKSTLTPKQQCKLEKFFISNHAIFGLEGDPPMAVETRAQDRKKMVPEPSDQPALGQDQDPIVNLADLPDQSTNPALEMTCQKIGKEKMPQWGKKGEYTCLDDSKLEK